MDAAARIILLTTFDDEEDIYRGIRAGAKGYLLKDALRDDILNCIRKGYRGEIFMSPQHRECVIAYAQPLESAQLECAHERDGWSATSRA